MSSLRHIIRAHRSLAALLIALALLLKMIVPTGFMPNVDTGKITITMCSGYGPMTLDVATPGVNGHDHDQPTQKKADAPCVFGGLAMPGLSGADPVQLAVALAFILIAALRPALRPSSDSPNWLRPPLRGPPQTA